MSHKNQSTNLPPVVLAAHVTRSSPCKLSIGIIAALLYACALGKAASLAQGFSRLSVPPCLASPLTLSKWKSTSAPLA